MDDDFIAALEHLDRAGDVPGGPDNPTAIALRARAQREHAVAWDETHGRYVLTGTGRLKVAGRKGRAGAAREAQTAEIRPFRPRGEPRRP